METRSNTWKTFNDIVKQIVAGERNLPNEMAISADQAVERISTFNYTVIRGHVRGADGHKIWATYFLGAPLDHPQDGGGMVLYYPGKAAVFAVCNHQKTEEGHRPNHMRGWHPGHCALCGIDMSVDSGD